MVFYKFCGFNINGTFGKIPELIHFLGHHQIDIMVVSETHLTENHRFHVRGYNVYRHDKTVRSGGIAILVKSSIPHRTIDSPDIDESFENICIELADETVLVGVYKNPRYELKTADLNNIFSLAPRVVVIGDMNSRHPAWNCPTPNGSGIVLHRYTLDHDRILLHHPDEPTHYPANGGRPSTIDLVLTKGNLDPSSVQVFKEMNSDHYPIVFEMLSRVADDRSRSFRDFRSTNWVAFRRNFDEHLGTIPPISNVASIDNVLDHFIQSIQIARDSNQTIKQVREDRDCLPNNILNLISLKNRVRRRFQQTRLLADRILVAQISRQIRESIANYRDDKWQRFTRSLKPDDNSLWRISRGLKRKSEPIPFLEIGNQTALRDQDKATMLANLYESFNRVDPVAHTPKQRYAQSRYNQFHEIDYVRLSPRNFNSIKASEKEIAGYLQRTPTNKAPGPDNIEPIVVRNLSRKGIACFAEIVNACLRFQYYPRRFKDAIVVPIHKGGGKSKNDPSAYRPVSLISIFAKILDKIILSRLADEVEGINLLPAEQFGFREGRSTVLQVARIIHNIKENFQTGQNTFLLSLDMKHAFDGVWHPGLVAKLHDCQVPLWLVKILHSFLFQRRFLVRVGNARSQYRVMQGGVPQGSALSPLLYSLYTCDFPLQTTTQTALYADDVAIYASSFHSQTAVMKVQDHISRSVLPYLKENKITLNEEKSDGIIFSKKFKNNRITRNLKLNEKSIEIKKDVRYLGVHIDSRLNMHSHVRNLLFKGNAAYRCLYPLLSRRSGLSLNSKVLLYKQIIRPVMTYAAPLFISGSQNLILKLQRLQNKILRHIANVNRYVSIRRLHDITNMETLKDHIYKISDRFYRFHVRRTPLTRDLTNIREDSRIHFKHGLLYRRLHLYHESIN